MTRRPAILVLLSVGALQAQSDDARFFEEKVRPILVSNCQGCHNDEAKMSGLSLATREGAMLGGSRGSAVIPGQVDESLLIEAVRRAGALKMPPTGPLPAEDVESLVTWIRSGATWDESSGRKRATASHWSFQPVARPEPPVARNTRWARNPIDNFILRKLEEKETGNAQQL